MITENVKGFRDIEDSSKRIKIKEIIENEFNLYNFKPVETPIIEYEEFIRGNNPNDEAVSDIFKLEDKGKRKLALRYEFTFQLKRLSQNKKLPFKRYQIGEVFRDEPIKENRFRQFTQCDADIIGSEIKDEVELLKMTSEILKKLNIKYKIYFNNRKLLNEILDELKLSNNKSQILREIDKLDKISENEIKENLKKYNAEKILEIIKKDEKYFEKYASYNEIKEFKKYCKLYNVSSIEFTPFLARGLSYYNGTIFEIKSNIKETIAAGGSYLINNFQSTGISFGLDRLEIISKIKIENKNVLIISLNQDKKAIELSDKIRELNIPCSVFYGKPSKALEYANSYQIPYVIFLGEEEVKKDKIKIKNMKTGKENLISANSIKKILEV